MRTLNYKLADGTIVKTFQEAKASGQNFTDYMAEVPRKKVQGSFIRESIKSIFGVVNKKNIQLYNEGSKNADSN